MKTWLITLPLLFFVSLAMADDSAQGQPQAQTETAKVPAKAKAKAKSTHSMRHKAKSNRLPRGDLRHCLELKGKEAIIHCAETDRKK
jgi:hypothetical protein